VRRDATTVVDLAGELVALIEEVGGARFAVDIERGLADALAGGKLLSGSYGLTGSTPSINKH
jgi:hypothetical protein